MIVLDKLGKSFGAMQAVRKLSISVKRGEMFRLGAGKTNTIRMMTGLQKRQDTFR